MILQISSDKASILTKKARDLFNEDFLKALPEKIQAAAEAGNNFVKFPGMTEGQYRSINDETIESAGFEVEWEDEENEEGDETENYRTLTVKWEAL